MADRVRDGRRLREADDDDINFDLDGDMGGDEYVAPVHADAPGGDRALDWLVDTAAPEGDDEDDLVLQEAMRIEQQHVDLRKKEKEEAQRIRRMEKQEERQRMRQLAAQERQLQKDEKAESRRMARERQEAANMEKKRAAEEELERARKKLSEVDKDDPEAIMAWHDAQQKMAEATGEDDKSAPKMISEWNPAKGAFTYVAVTNSAVLAGSTQRADAHSRLTRGDVMKLRKLNHANNVMNEKRFPDKLLDMHTLMKNGVMDEVKPLADNDLWSFLEASGYVVNKTEHYVGDVYLPVA